MTFGEIIEKTKELNLTKEDIAHGDFDEYIFGRVKEVYAKGGEGKGEHWERVYHFIDHNVYLSMTGYYTSYDGVDCDNYEPVEVKPKEKTITVYE